MPLFSIIIPVYNTAEYLDECLLSILEQNFSNLEIILVNDCSSDKSGEIADRYSAQYDNILTLHHEKNLGVSQSRNDGIKLAGGEYVLFIDSDDRIFDGSLSGLEAFINENIKPDVIICRVISQHGEYSNAYMFDDSVLATTDPDKYLAHLNKDNFHPECCWHYVINRSFLVENELFFGDMKIAEDQEFVTRLLCRISSFLLYMGDYYWYRERDHSLKKSMDLEAGFSLLKVVNSYCDFVKKGQLSKVKIEFIQLRIAHALGLFSARLVMLEAEDVKFISRNFYKFNKNNEMLIKGFLEDDLNSTLASYKGDNYFIEYRKLIISNTLSQVRKYKFDTLYVYCTGLIGKAAVRILTDNGYHVSAILDDNDTLEGLTMNGIEICTSKILLKKTQVELNNIFILVCNQKTMLFERIVRNLEGKGILKDQVVHKYF